MVGPPQEIAPVMLSGQADPFERSTRDRNLLRQVALLRNAKDHRVFQPGAEYVVRLVKISAGIVRAVRRGPDDDSVNFESCTRRGTGDAESFGKRSRAKT